MMTPRLSCPRSACGPARDLLNWRLPLAGTSRQVLLEEQGFPHKATRHPLQGSLSSSMTNARPHLDRSLASEAFLDHYWLKEELVAFCRSQGLIASGAKADLSARIAGLLSGSTVPATRPKTPRARMPSAFSPDSVIEPGWRCSQDLRAFFTTQLGGPFRFDRFMRDRISHGAGQTLGQVLQAWAVNARQATPSEIEPQFEYNRFMREFRSLRPDAAHAEVVAAWRSYRSVPVSKRPKVADLAEASSAGSKE